MDGMAFVQFSHESRSIFRFIARSPLLLHVKSDIEIKQIDHDALFAEFDSVLYALVGISVHTSPLVALLNIEIGWNEKNAMC